LIAIGFVVFLVLIFKESIFDFLDEYGAGWGGFFNDGEEL